MHATITTPAEAHAKIAAAAERPLSDVRHVAKIKVGQFIRQGDIYLTRIAKRAPNWQPTGNRQLAPGTSPGSRHVVGAGPRLFVSPEAIPREVKGRTVRLLGPQVEADKSFALEHPEHAHFELPAGTYQVSFQLDYAQQSAVRD